MKSIRYAIERKIREEEEEEEEEGATTPIDKLGSRRSLSLLIGLSISYASCIEI